MRNAVVWGQDMAEGGRDGVNSGSSEGERGGMRWGRERSAGFCCHRRNGPNEVEGRAVK